MHKTKYYCDRCGEEKNKDFVINVAVGERVVRDVGWIALSSRSGYKKEDIKRTWIFVKNVWRNLLIGLETIINGGL